MENAVEFYNLISPLVDEKSFCMDIENIFNLKKHPICPSNPRKHRISAGIKRVDGKIVTFLSKENQESNFSYKLILFFIIVSLVYKLNKSKHTS